MEVKNTHNHTTSGLGWEGLSILPLPVTPSTQYSKKKGLINYIKGMAKIRYEIYKELAISIAELFCNVCSENIFNIQCNIALNSCYFDHNDYYHIQGFDIRPAISQMILLLLVSPATSCTFHIRSMTFNNMQRSLAIYFITHVF